jgi:hypothetical protein
MWLKIGCDYSEITQPDSPRGKRVDVEERKEELSKEMLSLSVG